MLITGGTERLLRSIADALTAGPDRTVRVLASWAAESREAWPDDVELVTGMASDPAAFDAAARGCDAAVVVHPGVVGVTDPADAVPANAATGTHVRRLVVVSPDIADDDVPADSAHHGDRLLIRTAPVYGAGPDPITLFLVMMRSLPAVPLLSDSHAVQPLWHEDLARAVAASLSFSGPNINRVVRLHGPDAVTQAQLYERIAALIDRRPARVPVPDFLAEHAARLTASLGWTMPFDDSHLAFAAAAAAEPANEDALSSVFGVQATSLDEGLRRLANELPEHTPLQGTGSAEIKRFWADIRGSRYDAVELLRLFRERFRDIMPIAIGVEPVSPQTRLVEGEAIAMALPGRGHVQVRVEEATDDRVVLATLKGHVLAGAVRFATRPLDGGVRFEVTTCDAAADPFHWLTLSLGGTRGQNANWRRVVQNVVTLSGGESDGVQYDKRPLEPDEVERADEWIAHLVRQREAGAREG